MKKRSVRLLLSLVLFTLSLGSPFSSVLAIGLSGRYSEAAREKLIEFVDRYAAITPPTQQDPNNLKEWRSDIYSYISYLIKEEGYMAGGDFFKDLVVETDEERGKDKTSHIGDNYVEFLIYNFSSEVTGFFYKTPMCFFPLII